jgi:hypothetical protein
MSPPLPRNRNFLPSWLLGSALAVFALLLACHGSSGVGGNGDAEAVAAAKTALLIQYAPGDSASGVTRKLGLPTTGASGTTVTWASSHTSTVSTTGVVNRPTTGQVVVTLTAAISRGRAMDNKVFTVAVISTVSAASTPDLVQASGAAQTVGTSQNTMVVGETLPATTAQGAGGTVTNTSGFQITPPKK